MYGAHSKFDNDTTSTEYRRSRKGYCLASGWQYAKKCCCETWCQSECRWPTLATAPSNEFYSKSSTFGKTPKHYKQRGPLHHQPRQRTTTARRLRDNLRTATGTRVSDQTIRNRLRANNLRCRRQAVRPPLLPRHRTARRHWCTPHLRCQRVQWGRVMFTDESRFSIQFNDGRVRVYRRPGERFADINVRQRHRFQPVLHGWYNKGRGMCHPVCGMMHIKEPLLLIGKSSPCGGSWFPLSLSEWSFTICLTPDNRKYNMLSASLNKIFPSFLP